MNEMHSKNSTCKDQVYNSGILTIRYRLMNHVNEYWYIGSMFARSDMQKKRIAE